MARFCHENELPPLPADAAEPTRARIDRLLHSDGDEIPAKLREEMQEIMMQHVGVFREEGGLKTAVEQLAQLQERYNRIRIQDKSRVFNTDLLEAWELGALLDLAQVTAVCALNRTESRGAHSREDYPRRNDEQWLKHTLAARRNDGTIEIRYKPVVITKFQPQERVY
jgi:succinate dehydrogenase / fumarate reductase flavoprotein subunit